MQKVLIDRYRIVPAPQTGIGWVTVQEWDKQNGEYKSVSTFRTMKEAKKFTSQIMRLHDLA